MSINLGPTEIAWLAGAGFLFLALRWLYQKATKMLTRAHERVDAIVHLLAEINEALKGFKGSDSISKLADNLSATAAIPAGLETLKKIVMVAAVASDNNRKAVERFPQVIFSGGSIQAPLASGRLPESFLARSESKAYEHSEIADLLASGVPEDVAKAQVAKLMQEMETQMRGSMSGAV